MIIYLEIPMEVQTNSELLRIQCVCWIQDYCTIIRAHSFISSNQIENAIFKKDVSLNHKKKLSEVNIPKVTQDF